MRAVFKALVSRVEKNPEEVVVPVESVPSAKDLLSFIIWGFEYIFDTPFKREFLTDIELEMSCDDETGEEGLAIC